MSVASNGSGSFQRTTNVPAPSNFTACFWARWDTASLTGNYFQSMFGLDGGSYLQLGSNGGSDPELHLYCGVGASNTTIHNPGDAWFFYALVGSATNVCTVYYRAATANALTSVACGGGSSTATGLYFLVDSNGSGQRADRAQGLAFKVWDAQLTVSELLAESYFVAPQRRANINTFVPFYGAGGTDESGLGRNLTVNGTPIATGATPPIKSRRSAAKVFLPFGAAALSVSPGSIASAEAFGTPRIDLTVAPTGIASSEALGSPTLTLGVAPSSISSAEAFGTPSVGIGVSPSSIAGAEAFGTAAITLEVSPGGIASYEAFGLPTVAGDGTIVAVSIPTSEAFGASTVTVDALVSPTGIPSDEAFGVPSVGLELFAVGIPSAEAFGALTVAGDGSIIPTGISSDEAFGALFVTVIGEYIASSPSPMRRLTVRAEDRNLRVAREDRVCTIPPEDRGYRVSGVPASPLPQLDYVFDDFGEFVTEDDLLERVWE